MSKKDKDIKDQLKEDEVTTDTPEINVAEENAPTEVEKLTSEIAGEKEKYLRLMAEYDNFRKRSAKEKLDCYSDATAKVIGEVLPIYDNFERALESETTDENFKKGIGMIFNQFTESLKKLGIEVINPVGEEFDPNVAQAINQIEDENFGENTVAQVFQKGYKTGDKVIRYAMVVVANP